MDTSNDKMQELSLDALDMVTGGLNVGMTKSSGEPAAYCKVCKMKLMYLGQERVEGGNTGVYKCTNTYYKGYGHNCPEYNKLKYNDEVDFH